MHQRLTGPLHAPPLPLLQEACWTISNITAGTKEQIQSVVDAGIIPPLVHLLSTAGALRRPAAHGLLAPGY